MDSGTSLTLNKPEKYVYCCFIVTSTAKWYNLQFKTRPYCTRSKDREKGEDTVETEKRKKILFIVIKDTFGHKYISCKIITWSRSPDTLTTPIKLFQINSELHRGEQGRIHIHLAYINRHVTAQDKRISIVVYGEPHHGAAGVPGADQSLLFSSVSKHNCVLTIFSLLRFSHSSKQALCYFTWMVN